MMIRLMSLANLSYFEALRFPADIAIDLICAENAAQAMPDEDDGDDDEDIPMLPNGRPWPPGMLKLRRMLGG